MSGFEVAGIVLAVLPVFISAFEHYNGCLDPAKAFWRWERQLPEHIRSLRDAAALYEMNLDALVAPVTTPAERDAMIDTSYHALWKDSAVQDRVFARLGKARPAFDSNMDAFQNICKDIAGCLDLDSVNPQHISQDKLDSLLKAGVTNSAGRFELKRRAKFGWSKKRIKALLEELHKCNATLRHLTDLIRRLDPYRPNAKRKSPTISHLHLVHAHACRLYHALCKAWTCSKHPSHLAGIQLERRLLPPADSGRVSIKAGSATAECFVFRVAFSASHVHPHPTKGVFRQLEFAISEVNPDLSSPPSTPATSTTTLASGVKVSFSVDLHDKAPTIDTEALALVENMCKTLQRHETFPKYGFFLDASNHDSLRGIYPPEAENESWPSGDAELVRLEDVLPFRKPHSSVKGLSIKQRVLLAVTLASSILQLHSTAWLAQGWSKRAVSFLLQGGNIIDAERPLLVYTFGQNPVPTEIGNESPKKANPESKVAMLSLGVLLLELYSGETLESRLAPHNDEIPEGAASSWKRLEFAKEWLDEEIENLSSARQTAISFCLEAFVGIRTNLEDAVFRSAVHEEVVLPLAEEAKDFLGIALKELR